VPTRDLFLQVDYEKTWKKPVYVWPIATNGHITCPMAVSSGFYWSPETPPLGDVLGIVPAIRRNHQNWAKLVHFFIINLFAVALAAARAIQGE
jgi:hypothetical protein